MHRIIITIFFLLGLTFSANAGLLTLKDLPPVGQWYACQDQKTLKITYTTVHKYFAQSGMPNTIIRVLEGELSAKGTDKTVSIMFGPKGIKGFDPKNLPIWTDHSRTWYLNGKVVGESRQKCRRVESYEGYEN